MNLILRTIQRVLLSVQRGYERERKISSLMDYLDEAGDPLGEIPACPRCNYRCVNIESASLARCYWCSWRLQKAELKPKGIAYSCVFPGCNYWVVVADGPWEAIFLLCGMLDISPAAVYCEQTIRHKNGEYTVRRRA